jgi:hypothetical protein
MNLIQTQNYLRQLSDQQLQMELRSAPDTAALATGEMVRRQNLRRQESMQQGQKPSIYDQLLSGSFGTNPNALRPSQPSSPGMPPSPSGPPARGMGATPSPMGMPPGLAGSAPPQGLAQGVPQGYAHGGLVGHTQYLAGGGSDSGHTYHLPSAEEEQAADPLNVDPGMAGTGPLFGYDPESRYYAPAETEAQRAARYGPFSTDPGMAGGTGPLFGYAPESKQYSPGLGESPGTIAYPRAPSAPGSSADPQFMPSVIPTPHPDVVPTWHPSGGLDGSAPAKPAAAAVVAAAPAGAVAPSTPGTSGSYPGIAGAATVPGHTKASVTVGGIGMGSFPGGGVGVTPADKQSAADLVTKARGLLPEYKPLTPEEYQLQFHEYTPPKFSDFLDQARATHPDNGDIARLEGRLGELEGTQGQPHTFSVGERLAMLAAGMAKTGSYAGGAGYAQDVMREDQANAEKKALAMFQLRSQLADMKDRREQEVQQQANALYSASSQAGMFNTQQRMAVDQHNKAMLVSEHNEDRQAAIQNALMPLQMGVAQQQLEWGAGQSTRWREQFWLESQKVRAEFAKIALATEKDPSLKLEDEQRKLALDKLSSYRSQRYTELGKDPSKLSVPERSKLDQSMFADWARTPEGFIMGHYLTNEAMPRMHFDPEKGNLTLQGDPVTLFGK